MPWFISTPTLADPLPVQQITLRQGDRLSAFAAIIEDEYGVALNLVNARCFLTLRPLTQTIVAPLVDGVEMVIANAATGQVSYDWQAIQTLQARPGLYDVLIEVNYVNGTVITVPSADQAAIVNLRSSIAAGWFVVDADGALIPNGAGGFLRDIDIISLEDGTPWLLEDGSYWVLESAP